MYVKDSMTKNPVTITRDTVLSKAITLMDQGHFHRLPVVNETGKLIGLVTSGLVEEGTGQKSTSLSIYELNYLLSRTKAEDLMIRDVKTVSPDMFLEEAAQRMIDNHISVLPVVDDDEKVVGIITEKDVFQAFVDLTGYKTQGTRFVVVCPDEPGQFRTIADLFAKENANLENISVYHTERGVEVEVKATGEVSVEKMTKVLTDGGYKITNILQTKADGSMVHYPLPE